MSVYVIISLLTLVCDCRAQAIPPPTVSVGAVSTSNPAESMDLQDEEIGVEYVTTDFVLVAKVHSVKQAPVIGALGVSSPLPAFDANCLFIYNQKSRKQLMATWLLKHIKYKDPLWHKRTQWFRADGIKHGMLDNAGIQAFLMACPVISHGQKYVGGKRAGTIPSPIHVDRSLPSSNVPTVVCPPAPFIGPANRCEETTNSVNIGVTGLSIYDDTTESESGAE